MNARMSSRPFLYTPGRIIVPSAANSSANAVASWAAHARTSRAGIAAISARSASDGPAAVVTDTEEGLVILLLAFLADLGWWAVAHET